MEVKKKLTLSCSKCRIAKLKCDRKEPCTECVKRNRTHLCVKDERLPRRKRTKVDHSSDDVQENYEEKTIEVLEDYIFDAKSDTLSANGDMNDIQTQHRNNDVKPDKHNPYWQNLSNDGKREREHLELVAEIAASLPSLELIKALTEVFVTRCQAPIGNVVHTPTHILRIERLCACIDSNEFREKKYAILESFGMDTLACLLLSLKLGLAFHPSPKFSGWSPSEEALQVEKIRSSGEHRKDEEWGKLAQRCLKSGLVPFTGSIASLQACIMILLDGQEDRATLDNILACAISGARSLGLHKLGRAELGPLIGQGGSSMTMPNHIRTELGVRIWWALSIHDWSHAQVTGQFTIHPSEVSTRKPLHINDQDLISEALSFDDQGYIVEQPKTQFTMLSYTVCVIGIAKLLRDILQMSISSTSSRSMEEIRKKYGKRYEALLADLPPYFRLGSTIGVGVTNGLEQAVPIHRWMIHQQLWSLLLRFHRNYLANSIGSQHSEMLALNIIGSQAQLQSSCVVCGSLTAGISQMLYAAAVLLFELLRRRKSNSNDRLVRLMIRDKVSLAIELLRGRIDQDYKGYVTTRGIRLLEALMEFEEAEANNNASDGRMSTDPLKEKITRIISSLQNQPKNTNDINPLIETNASHTRPVISATDLLMDMNVLPITTEDQFSQNFDLDQFIDSFTTSQSDIPEEDFELGEFLNMMTASPFSSFDTMTTSSLDAPSTSAAANSCFTPIFQ
ncbi:uncharacterized protein FA14DRAFT_160285 [Meira miltonrushii]|uniref:Zn(2)-C6 fungal-type domain-containing protein n=1 Tax=Meira miltonrushii TaxID=1280837 RepID=A0A316VH87_9BASI|nr:uncharacterized protein FA14DRAFT_160285 [Meira miltonrushii]PWN34865.1 hypothetical protein FA14DRAFT_160285 [Meira miltonrushii]